MNNVLTIVIVMDYAFVNGGLAKVGIDSALGLKKAGHNPIMFTAVGPVDQKLVDAGIETICLGQSDLAHSASKISGILQGMWNVQAADALGRLLDRLPRSNTVIHVQGWAAALSPSIALPIQKSRLPVVTTLHDGYMFCPTGNLFNSPKNAVCTLKPLSLDCLASNCDHRNYARKLFRTARLVMAQQFFKLPQTFKDYILISDFQEQKVRQYLPKDIVVHRVANPVDVEDAGPKKDPTAGDVIYAGRLSPEKGSLLFAKAAHLVRQVPVFVGDGFEAHIIRQQFPEARILGWHTHEALREAVRNARALVFPSIVSEIQPLTVLEAKALGTPVILADQCAGREEIEDGVSGIWFESGNETSLAAALMKIKDDGLVSKLSQQAYSAYWSSPYTLERHIAKILSVYAEIMSR